MARKTMTRERTGRKVIPRPTKAGKKVAAKRRVTTKQSGREGQSKRGRQKGGISPVKVTVDGTEANLQKVNHIVVLMMENRSFDHMVGYLSLTGALPHVDGLRAGMTNSYEGTTFPIHHLTQTAFAAGQDPCHSGACVAEQVSNGNAGFVSNYAQTHPEDTEPDRVIGYYDGADLPVYDYLARKFCVCDRWFSSVPGATWPNRLYAVTGTAAGSKDNKKIPLYDLPAFVRQLDTQGVSWRWYSHDVTPTLQLIDSRYRLDLSHFHYFDRPTLLGRKSFLEQAAAGELPAVSWIDPNFIDFIASGANDDHAPGDVHAGQALVLQLYDALVHSPLWEETLLVVTYDEHGGFYDHVIPPAAEDDSPQFRAYGPRVPTLVVSPWVDAGPASTVFDHTSILKSIFLRFCWHSDQSIPDLGTRVTKANHLGSLLTRATPRQQDTFTDYQSLIEWVGDWKKASFQASLSKGARTKRLAPPPLTEFQRGFIAAKKRLLAEGTVKSF